MAHSSSTSFPDQIDDRNYFTDVVLQHTDILQSYQELIDAGQLKEASQYLYDNVEAPGLDMDYNGSYLWNRFETKIPSIEQYALDMEATNIRGTYSRTEPTGKAKGHVWIS